MLLSACWFGQNSNTNITDFKRWKDIKMFSNFVSPWDEQPYGETTFQYYNDTSWFYFLFRVDDDDIQLCDTSNNEAQNVLQSDRVELFFTKDSLMQPYYTFEMDAASRLFDARCLIHQKNKTNKKEIDANWNICKEDLQFKSTKGKNGYRVEGKIAMSFLQKNHLTNNGKLWCGIQRANFHTEGEPQWICAKDPGTNYPEFHCWGVFIELEIN